MFVLGIIGLIFFGIGAASLILYAVVKAFVVGGYVLGMFALMIAGFITMLLAAALDEVF